MARQSKQTFDGRLLINGKRTASEGEQQFDCISPLNGKVLTQVARGQAADIDAAVAAARAAFADKRWAGKAPAARKKIMLKWTDLIDAARDELALDADIPEGVLNVVTGFGHEAGEALALHMDVDAIGFTGSTAVGRKMLAYSAQSNLKRVYNELGGKSANIVFNDFDNLERAAATAAGCIFFNQGESCNAPSRLLVQDDIADAFTDMVLKHVPSDAPADPLEETTVMGALVDAGQHKNVLRYIEAGKTDGATCAAGGAAAMQDTGGYYVAPTVFTGVNNQMKIAREEIFGPVLSIIRFKDEAQAVAIANDSPYGLQAGVWSSNINRAHRVARNLQAGTVHVNQYDDDDMTVPFGGFKQSGIGRDKSLHALDKYTELKTTWLRIDRV